MRDDRARLAHSDATAEFCTSQAKVLIEKIDEQCIFRNINFPVALVIHCDIDVDVRHQRRASNIFLLVIGSERNLLPVACAIALARAGGTGHKTASAMPRGGSPGSG